MCLAAFSIGQSERFPIVLVSNRDEFFARASQPLAWWQPSLGVAPILSGRDLTGGGTWMGLNAAGRLALVTNVREPGRHLASAPSRGNLVLQCLAGMNGDPDGDPHIDPPNDPHLDLTAFAVTPRNGFNLLSIDLAADPWQQLGSPLGQWVSNRPAVQGRALGPGAFGLSNASLDTPWPKVRELKQRLIKTVDQQHELDALMTELFAALRDPLPALDAELPQTGVTLERERQLSSAFIRIAAEDGGVYGTRCSTLVVVQALVGRRNVHVVERTFDESGREAGTRTERFKLPAQR